MISNKKQIDLDQIIVGSISLSKNRLTLYEMIKSNQSNWNTYVDSTKELKTV